jgi:hypothetical protein
MTFVVPRNKKAWKTLFPKNDIIEFRAHIKSTAENVNFHILDTHHQLSQNIPPPKKAVPLSTFFPLSSLKKGVTFRNVQNFQGYYF